MFWERSGDSPGRWRRVAWGMIDEQVIRYDYTVLRPNLNECPRAPRSTIFLRVRTDTSWRPHRSMRMHGYLRGSDNEAGIVRGSLGLRCLFAAVSFAVHARSNRVRRRSRGRLKCDPLGAHEPFDKPRSIIDYLRTKRPRSRNEHPTNCGRSQLHS